MDNNISNTIDINKCTNKIVVFDLDETLGYFVELGMFWDSLTHYLKDPNLNIKIPDKQELFNSVLDLYPEFLRPNIINILKYLKKKKEQDKCHKLMIYTNNQGPKTWANHIISYFETKIQSKLFDQLIAAFKVQGKRVEICRSTHLKTHKDLIKCTKISEDTQICFIDDVFYPDMSNKNIYYINIKPYIYDLPFNIMIDRFIKSDKLTIPNKTVFHSKMIEQMKKYNHTYTEKIIKAQEIDIILSKKILHHLEEFFGERKTGKYVQNKRLLTRTKNKDNIIRKNKTIKIKR
jgi:hypothetical protein